jgi:hypothetical protein
MGLKAKRQPGQLVKKAISTATKRKRPKWLRGVSRLEILIGLFRSYFFSYHSAFLAVKACHLSGKSSKAKIAVTGQTGTQAPQSMHSTGLMYSIVSVANCASSLRG